MATSKEKLQIIVDAQGIAKTKAQLKGMEKATGGAGKSFIGMAAGIAGATAAMYALGKAVKIGMEFEQSMANVKAISGATNVEFKALEANAKALGASTKFTASEVAGLQTEYAKLGFTSSEINKVTEGTLALASAVGADLADAAAVSGATLRGFGLDASETGRVTDVMAKSFSSSALDIQKFSDSMKYVAPISKMAGVSLEGTTAILGQLANAGIDGSMAGTSLRKILLEAGREGSKLAERMGGPIESFEDFQEKLIALKDDGFDPMAEGADLVGARAVTAFGILLDGADNVNTLNEAFKDAGGSAQEMADIQLDTLEGKMTIMNSAFEGLGIRIFDLVKGPLKEAVDGFTAFIGFLDEETLKSYATGLGIVATGFAIYKAEVILAATATKGFRSALMSTGIGAATVGVGILVGELIKMTSIFDEAEQEIDDTADAMKRTNSEWAAFKKGLDAIEDEEELIKTISERLQELQIEQAGHIKLMGANKIAMQSASGTYDDYLDSLEKDKESVKSLEEQYEDYKTSQKNNKLGLQAIILSYNSWKATVKDGKGTIQNAITSESEWIEKQQEFVKIMEEKNATHQINLEQINQEIEELEVKQEVIGAVTEIEIQYASVSAKLHADKLKEIDEQAKKYKKAGVDAVGITKWKNKEIEKADKKLSDEQDKIFGKTRDQWENVSDSVSAYTTQISSIVDTMIASGVGTKKEQIQMMKATQAIAIADAAAAIIKGYGQLGPVLGTVAAVATGLATGLQLTIIQNQIDEIRAAQFGMDEVVTKPTLILAGEAGPESVKITPLSDIGEAEGGGGDTQIFNISIEGNVMTDEFVEEELSVKISDAIRRGVSFSGLS